jgi:hypothetical protein
MNSYQFFHFNGADPLVKLTGAYKSGNNVVGLGWDKSDHCYVLTTTSLILWKVTPTSYKQLAVYTYPTPYGDVNRALSAVKLIGPKILGPLSLVLGEKRGWYFSKTKCPWSGS